MFIVGAEGGYVGRDGQVPEGEQHGFARRANWPLGGGGGSASDGAGAGGSAGGAVGAAVAAAPGCSGSHSNGGYFVTMNAP